MIYGSDNYTTERPWNNDKGGWEGKGWENWRTENESGEKGKLCGGGGGLKLDCENRVEI